MHIEQHIPLLEEILTPYQTLLGEDYQGYRNHVYRMIHCCFALHTCNEEERNKIIIAGCFHDLALWTEKTVDYLTPSAQLAMAYLQEKGLTQLSTDIELMIEWHHKIRCFNDVHAQGSSHAQGCLIEVFRRADLADFSLGLIKGGVPKVAMQEIKAAFPNAGFHKMLLKEQGRWLLKHPLNPFPILRW